MMLAVNLLRWSPFAFFFMAGAAALQIEQERATAILKHQTNEHRILSKTASSRKIRTLSSVTPGLAARKQSLMSATKKREVLNMANSLALLSRSTAASKTVLLRTTKKQNPTEEAAAEPPAGSLPIDEEGYAADWTTEHRSEPYPAESVGKQHHPAYDLTAAKIRAGLSHWWWILPLIIVGAVLGFFFYRKQ